MNRLFAFSFSLSILFALYSLSSSQSIGYGNPYFGLPYNPYTSAAFGYGLGPQYSTIQGSIASNYLYGGAGGGLKGGFPPGYGGGQYGGYGAYGLLAPYGPYGRYGGYGSFGSLGYGGTGGGAGGYYGGTGGGAGGYYGAASSQGHIDKSGGTDKHQNLSVA